MEQVGCSPRIPSVTRRDTESAPDDSVYLPEPIVNVIPRHNTTTSTSDLTPTTPTTNPTSTRDPLSTSEPSLRFPRPQGNRHLANWISSSDPAIMRVISTEEPGLSGSTYELVTGSDSEYQSEAYVESLSESVGSLEFHRLDEDTTSLADTEQTFDDESIADGFEPVANPVHHVHDEEPDISSSVDLQAQSQATITEQAPHHDHDDEYESEDDAASRSSLDYTQQSLKTPSIPTPEASRIVDRPAEAGGFIPEAEEEDDNKHSEGHQVFHDWYQEFREKEKAAWDRIMETGFNIPPVVLILIALLIPVLVSMTSPPSELHIPTATPAVTTHTTTAAIIDATTTSSSATALSTLTGSDQLVPLRNVKQDEGLFGGKKPDLAVFKQQTGQFLVRIPDDIKYAWLMKKCLSFSATRKLRTVPIDVSVAEDGMLIKFPQAECHGAVQVEITALCRPRIRQVFQITFEKGLMEEALEMTKSFAQNLTDLVPAAAQEAERRIEEARRSLGLASGNVLTASDSLLKDLMTRFHKAHRSLSPIKADAKERLYRTRAELAKTVDIIKGKATQHLANAQDVQDQAQLSLLDAQISAKLWWLKVTKNNNEHERYANKAKKFMADKKAEAIKSFLLRHPNVNDMHFKPSRLWKKVVNGPRCGKKLGRGKPGIQQCNFVV
ncbi:hypothetical protein B0T10DRAFT_559335 [Thelonectria olida]|uniref:Uncharacterized protein n=1 Tax=Thelonectria olida TaxID=1576542 RepID=A0A9P9AUY5_9HYPO|nr:hypothetical protein B0T10DRAFT_559335 [Thelonectria olida]